MKDDDRTKDWRPFEHAPGGFRAWPPFEAVAQIQVGIYQPKTKCGYGPARAFVVVEGKMMGLIDEDLTHLSVIDSPYLGADPIGFLTTIEGRLYILTKSASYVRENMAQLAVLGPRAAVMRIVLLPKESRGE